MRNGGRRHPAAASWPDAIVLQTSRSNNGRILIEARDRGAGIAARTSHACSIRSSRHGEREQGLGLATSRNIIEGMGGTISIQSRPASGTDVRIELPIAQVAERAQAPAAARR